MVIVKESGSGHWLNCVYHPYHPLPAACDRFHSFQSLYAPAQECLHTVLCRHMPRPSVWTVCRSFWQDTWQPTRYGSLWRAITARNLELTMNSGLLISWLAWSYPG